MLELKLDQIEVHFGNHHVLKGLNATFDAGKIHSVIGVNGAGKSVLLKTIAGLIHGSGQVLIRDQDCEYNMSDIAYVPQMAYSTSVLTAFEMVLLGKVKSLSWKVSKEIIQEVNEIMNTLGIAGLAGKTFSSLSGGQKQMVIMAQALISKPRVILLDEPTSALDLYHQLQLLDVTKEYCKKNQAIALTVMHDLSLVARYSDSILLLHEGKTLKQGKPDDVLLPDLLERVYRVRIAVAKLDDLTMITPVSIV